MAERVNILQLPKVFAEPRMVRLDGTEALSEISRFKIDVTSTTELVNPADVIAESFAAEVGIDNQTEPRLFGGVITSIEAKGWVHSDRYCYQLVVQSSMVLTTLNKRSRIFHEQDAKSIITTVLEDYSGKIEPKISIQGGTGVREYTVQFDESDYDFLSRLMAEEGIYFAAIVDINASSTYPETLTIADSRAGYSPSPQSAVGLSDASFDDISLRAWRPGHRLHSAAHELSDYNPLTPTQHLLTKSAAKSNDLAFQGSSRYTYPGRYLKRNPGVDLSALRMEQEEVSAHTIEGSSTYLHFAPASTVKLDKPPASLKPTEAVLIRVSHELLNLEQGMTSPSKDSTRDQYKNSFTAIPAENNFRPPEPPRRLMPGVQTATVIGDDTIGDVDVDEHARIKVKFHWNNDETDDGMSSCRIRCVQQWAGHSIGSVWMPRIGMEVIVDFIDGDPDRPLVVGCVYNSGEFRPLFKMPENKFISGWQTGTIPNKDKLTSLLFHDKPSEEGVTFYTNGYFERSVDEYDKLIVVKDRTLHVIEGDEVTTVEGGNRSIKVEAGNEDIAIAKGDQTISIDGGKHSLKVGKTSTIEAKSKITLKVGQSQLVMDSSSITLKSTNIKIQATANADIKANANVKIQGTAGVTVKAAGMMKIEGAMTDVAGKGMLTLKGGIVMIN
ncbi:MAG: type VI secretion system tip protein TssI/VgrG [Pseudomonadota bacterium]